MATLQNIGVLKYRDKNGKWQPLPVVLQGAGGAGGVTTISGNGVPNTSTVGRVNQLYRDEATDKLYICTGTDGAYTWAAVVSDTEDAVKYTGQTLTNVQKAQARANIGAGTSNFSGAYNDLTGKPNIPAAAVIDTTLTKAGQAADAKAVGDKITEVNGKVEDKLDATALPTAVNNALAQAKASGAFDGAKGEKGDPGEDGQAGTPGQNGVSPHIGTNGNWWIGTTDTGVSATGGSYTLPVATPDALGGVKPIGKTAAMTQDVGVDADGKLYTAPSGGGTDKSLGIASATVGQIAKITAVDGTGKPTGWEPVDIPSGGETWEKIADVALSAETTSYNVANFATWRKIKLFMQRGAYISGLSKNVWIRIKNSNFADVYTCGYLANEYGYIFWEFEAEVNNMTITSHRNCTNNLNNATGVLSVGTQLLGDVSIDNLFMYVLFTDTSVIQSGDTITVLGVRR